MPARAAATRSAAAADSIREAARATEPDRYLSSLLAPRAARDDLLVIAAFLGDVARIPRTVRDPGIARIRLQWWADAIEGHAGQAAPTGAPLADAVRSVVARRGIATGDLAAVVDARFEAIDRESVGDEAALDRVLAATEGGGFRLAARVLEVPETRETLVALDAAGVAYGLARVLAALAGETTDARLWLPETWPEVAALVAEAPSSPTWTAAHRALMVRGAAHARAKMRVVHDFSAHSTHSFNAAVLPCALVEPYLQALERRPGTASGPPVGLEPLVTPLTRVWTLWRAHWRGRL